ncbi:MAG: transglutaminase domain-containing protein [Candidatus Thermoplasmatota archaeon]
MRLSINNSEGEQLYVTAARITWLPEGIWSERDLSVPALHRGVTQLGLLNVLGPGTPGAHEYQISLRLLLKVGGAWYRLTSMGGQWTRLEPGVLDVLAHGSASRYDVHHNQYNYYDRVNRLLAPNDPLVIEAVGNATQDMAGGYTIEKLAAIFDYVSATITYEEEDGGDCWKSPAETLLSRRGDCEDYSILLAAMAMHLGGTARVYLLDDHAFAAFWAGDDPGIVRSALESYYGTEIDLRYLVDEWGAWLVADPLGSLHLGGLPVNAAPVDESEGWDFTETLLLLPVDCTGSQGEVRPWEDARTWSVALVASGALLVASLLLLMTKAQERCALCGAKVSEGEVRCACGAVHHAHCAEYHLCCGSCGSPLLLENRLERD